MNDAKTDKQLRLYVGLVASGGAVCLLWAAATAPAVAPGKLFYLAALTVIIAAASGPLIELRVRSDHRSFSSTSGSILIAVATVPLPWVIICTAIGVLASKMFVRDPMKIVFNVAKDTAAATAAVATAYAIGVRPTAALTLEVDDLPLLALGLTLAAVAYAVVDDLLGHTVVAMATRTSWRQSFSRNWDVVATVRLANVGLALLVALVIDLEQLLIVAMIPAVLALQFATKNRIRQRADQEAWQRLASSTDRLNVTELTSVLTAAVTRAPELFSADEAEIELSDTDPPRLIRGSAGGLVYEGRLATAPLRDSPAIEAQLAGPDTEAVGTLRLRFRKPVKLSDSERYKLQTFASSLYTAIRNARAYAELKRINAENAYAAAHDPLTGLANRRELLEQAAEVFKARAADGLCAMLLIDLNHFKEVNDTLGHGAGDQVLREVAKRLEDSAQPGDLVARLGGDEFAVLFTGLPTPAVAAHRAETMLADLERNIEVDGMQLTVEAAGGIAMAPASGGVQELMRRADVAMYQAKRSGQRTATYLHARDTADIGRLMLGGQLSRAVAEHEFVVDFQPIVDLGSGEVVSAEALARWHHPEHGSLSPMQFLETVERSGQLPAFADAVLEQSLTAYGMWREAGFDLPVAVNVSPRSLLDATFPNAVLARLAAHGVKADRLVLELAETLTLSQLEVVDRALSELRDAGVRLALDDFGTGVSSLSVLSRLPVHQLKIDREFVTAVETSSEAAAVIRSTVDLARSLHLTVIAEGVESEPQRHALWELGCVAGQGHLFSRPMRSGRMLAALQRGSGGRPGALASALHTAGSVVRMPHRRSPGHGRSSLPHLPA
ncbi:putative bifunctional diguanylate cyclase/phosphodiesterase [Actinoplanes friuliensis]|uniref:Diguanylate cyclase/phosphodiesterase n=1 Tax=Actinoplanes friuliensis DSM 7358 TaxID=1246995 RepID=U5WCV2_9ACTN|nr:bifunctional diguanylate cyclase/phosphodiesterase [Actinoplanes friuliensis]AGZ46802.1 diguanylate cyclase/phosphodiesterase [Actinoplanes friuliensis DSM 7358]